MSKTIKLAILALAFCFGAVLISGCTLPQWLQISQTDTDIEKTCCQECLVFVPETPGAENCLSNPGISKQCHGFFSKNPTKDEECMEGKINTLSDVIIPDGERQDEETAQYYEFKKKYENKKWRGTMSGEAITTMGGAGSCKETYTAQIEEMRMIFNGSPSSPDLLRNGELLSSIEIGGKAVLESAHRSCTCGEINVEISSFPFNLAGGVNLSEGTINFGAAEPEADEEFKDFYIETCGDNPGSFYGDNEPLFSIFEPSYAAFKFEGEKISLTSAFGNLSGAELFANDPTGILKNTKTNEKISGELVPF